MLGQGESALSPERLVWTGRVLDETEARLRQGGAQRTLLDLATIRLCRMGALSSLEELVGRLERGGPPAAGPGRGPAGRPPQSAGPPGGFDRPQSGPPRASAAPGPAAGPSAGAPAARPAPPPPSGPGSELLARLMASLAEIRPSDAAALRRAKSAQLGDDGQLEIVLPGDTNAIFKVKLSSEQSQKAIADAAQAAWGSRPSSIAITAEESAAPARPARPRVSRQEVIEQARKDPAVRALFERFGAVVLDGRSLEDDAPGA